MQKRTVADMKRETFSEVASKEAFLRAEPLLLKLKPGDAVNATGLAWSVYPIQEGSRTVGLLTKSDGWIECMSGGVDQAFYNFGFFEGRSGEKAFGSHIFGYVWSGINLVPKYLVRTQAVIISQSEYEQLKSRKTANLGMTWTPGIRNTRTYLKDIQVREVQPLDFAEPEVGRLVAGEAISTDGHINKYLTPAAFQESEQALKQIKKGMSLIETIKTLRGVFIIKATGDDITLFGMKGFLNVTSDHRWSTSGPDGVFSVWGFGYVEGGKEVPKLALIFRNGEVHGVFPYTDRTELEKQFSSL